ncbi:MAG: phosphohistidine phosphatase SixA [Candidatus Eisenbacteria bacterium]
MRLILFRHGLAGERDPLRWPEDRDRPLTEKGVERTRQAVRGILRLERRLTHVLASPLVRADQTAALLLVTAGLAGDPEHLESLVPGGSWRKTMARLEAMPADTVIALVGHEPDLGKLAGVLLFGAPRPLPLKKAGACSIDFEIKATTGAGTLRWFLAPRALRQLAGRRKNV